MTIHGSAERRISAAAPASRASNGRITAGTATAAAGASLLILVAESLDAQGSGRNPIGVCGHEDVMAELSDGALWAHAATGDADAFGALFERHARAVYNYSFRRTADWAAAEDLTSAVFLEAWRRRREVVLHRGDALPWLLGVATNLVRNRARSLRRHRAALERVPAPPPSPDFADDVVGRLDDERQMRCALRVLGELPRREQDVVALCAWSGMTYEEAAIALDLPLGTVRSRLSRARRRIRELTARTGHEVISEA